MIFLQNLRFQYLIILTIFQFIALVYNASQPKIAIIGAGLGGTATSYYLSQKFKNAQLDIYESSGLIGGRIRKAEIGGDVYEVGATAIHPDNYYMANYTQMLGLRPRASMEGRFGYYNGEEVVMTTSSYAVVTTARFLWRYGSQVFKMKGYTETLMEDFSKIYLFQDLDLAFTKPELMLRSMSDMALKRLYQTTKSDLLDYGFSELFVDELVMAGLQANFGQTTDIHSFVGGISFATFLPGAWAVHGGNSQIPQGLQKESGANLIRRAVKTVILSENSSYILETDDGFGKVEREHYDIVILTSPLHDNLTTVEFQGFPDPIKNYPEPYQTTVVTFVQGLPNYERFGYGSAQDFPEGLLSSDPKNVWNYLVIQTPVNVGPETKRNEGRPVYKVVSKRVLTEKEMSELFTNFNLLETFTWPAYPKYSGVQIEIPSFELHDNLYYTSAMELCSSTMETIAVSARNVALLAYNQWFDNRDKIDLDSKRLKELHQAMSKQEL